MLIEPIVSYGLLHGWLCQRLQRYKKSMKCQYQIKFKIDLLTLFCIYS